MLGLDWTELALIAVVAVVIIGPKDLPDAVRGIAKGIQKLRRMAGEFQGQVDEVVREAKLEDVRSQINDIRSFNVRDMVEKEIDKDGALRKTFTEDPIGNPLRDAFARDMPPPAHGAEVTPPPRAGEEPSSVPAANPNLGANPDLDANRGLAATPAPAFVPPAFIPPGANPLPAPVAASQPVPAPVPAPAFVPPSGTSAS